MTKMEKTSKSMFLFYFSITLAIASSEPYYFSQKSTPTMLIRQLPLWLLMRLHYA